MRYEAEETVGGGRKEGILMRVGVGVVLVRPRKRVLHVTDLTKRVERKELGSDHVESDLLFQNACNNAAVWVFGVLHIQEGEGGGGIRPIGSHDSNRIGNGLRSCTARGRSRDDACMVVQVKTIHQWGLNIDEGGFYEQLRDNGVHLDPDIHDSLGKAVCESRLGIRDYA